MLLAGLLDRLHGGKMDTFGHSLELSGSGGFPHAEVQPSRSAKMCYLGDVVAASPHGRRRRGIKVVKQDSREELQQGKLEEHDHIGYVSL